MSLQASRLSIHPDTKQLETTTFDLPEIGDHDVRIRVLFNSISHNDLLFLEGKNSNDFFGVGAVGRVEAVGKSVGSRKTGEIVGIYHQNINRDGFKTGFSSHLQVDASKVVFIPTSISGEHATSLLTDGIVAFNAVEHIPKGSSIAVIGTGNLAYLAVQFAKKVFGLHVTVISLGSAEGVAQAFGADTADVYSAQNTKKYEEKFDALIVTEPVPQAESKSLQIMAIRTGKVYITTKFNYCPSIIPFDLIVCQRQFIGVKRGDIAQYAKMLHAAAYANVRGRIVEVPANEFSSAFEKAKNSNQAQVVLHY